MHENLIRSTEIILPLLSGKIKRVGKNKVTHLIQAEETANVNIIDNGAGSYLLRHSDGRTIYLKRPKTRNTFTPEDHVVEVKQDGFDIALMDKNTKLSWKTHPQLENPPTPGDIIKAWQDIFKFKEEIPATGAPGLRSPQIGAIHAILAHWSVSQDCATIVMPTGTGKTEVMISALVVACCKRVLVLVPTNMLRSQAVSKFTNYGCLQRIGIMPHGIYFPRVACIEHAIRTQSHADELLQQSNVIVATTNVLNTCKPDIVKRLVEGCSHLFIDEAHHVAAKSWNEIRDLFKNKPIFQFTATPYRRDGKHLEGKIIYNYPLSLAQRNGYFRHIELVKIEEFDDRKADEIIAKRAIKLLDDDLSSGYDHLLMARARSIKRAIQIIEIYRKHGKKYNPMIVHSEMKSSDKAEALKNILARSSRIIIAVDMLGEGFDLPNLKIAAIHDIHKSLTVTIQFVGRFTRDAKHLGDARVVVNASDPQVQREVEALYSEDPDWNDILQQKSEETIKKEIDIQELIHSFSGELSQQVSLWNLRPKYSTVIYETQCENWAPDKFIEGLPPKCHEWHAISKKENMLAVVINKQEEVDWGKYKGIQNSMFEFCIAHWSPRHHALFIQCSDYDAFKCFKMAKAICGDTTKLKNGHAVFNVYSNIERPIARTLGASQAGSIRYTMYFGPDVAFGLSQVEKAESNLNNVFGWGFENGNKITVGSSAKNGKIWARGGGPITFWRDWCYHVAEKIFDDKIDQAKLISDFLKPVELKDRHPSVPLTVEWGEKITTTDEDNITVMMGRFEYNLYEIGIEIEEYIDSGPISISIQSENEKSIYKLNYDSGKCIYELTRGPQVKLKKYSGAFILFEEYMESDPVMILYADGSYSYNHFLVSPPPVGAFFDQARLKAIDWSGVDFKSESQGKERKKDSVQFRIAELIKHDDYEIIFDDDASYEAADIIAIQHESSEKIKIHLIHCKFASANKPGANINDFYALCGQAQKCIRWKHNGLKILIDHMKRREMKWRETNHTRFIKGDLSSLSRLRKIGKFAELSLAVTIAQPGLSKKEITSDIIQLLGATDNYLVKTARAVFEVICST